MAKSRKTPPRKKSAEKSPPEEVLDAEVVLPEAEPQDLEVDESTPTDPSILKAEAVVDDVKAAAEDTVDAAKNSASDAGDAVEAKADDVIEAAKDGADDISEAVSEKASEVGDGAADKIGDTTSEPIPDDRAVVAADTAPAKSGGIFGSVIGGMIAAAIGFGGAMLVFPEGWREKDDSLVTSLQTGLSEQAEKVTALTGQVGEFDGKLSELGTKIEGQLGGLKDSLTEGLAERGTEIAAVADRLQRLTEGEGMVALPDDVQLLLNAQKERIAELSTNVEGIAQSAQEQINGLSEEVAGMAADAQERIAAAAAQKETAEEAEARVKARAALQAVELSLVNGEPFADALEDIAPATDVPEALAALATEGAPTVAGLVQEYPALARSALSLAAREDTPESTGGALGSFFKAQLNARSLTPQEGDSADAVLSRVEAAVKAQDLDTALSEIEALPDAPKEVFADWTAQVEARQGAVNGYKAVSDALNGN